MGETVLGKWIMLGCVHKLKVVYCLCWCLYTIITDFGNINELDNVIYSTDFTRAEMHFCAQENLLEGCFEGVLRRQRSNMMQCVSWFLCLEGIFQAVISVILLPLVIEFFRENKGLGFIQFWDSTV